MRNKGFTLIELLAVIVILAIIALIATPIILGIINNSKKEADKRSAELYIKAAELGIARKNLTEAVDSTECTVQQSGNLVCTGVTEEIKVEMNGTKPDAGSKITFTNGKVTNLSSYKVGNTTYKLENGSLVVDDSSEDETFTGTIYTNSTTDEITYINESIVPHTKNLWCAVGYEDNEKVWDSCVDDLFGYEEEEDCIDEEGTCEEGTLQVGLQEGNYYTEETKGNMSGNVYLKHVVKNDVVQASYVCIKTDAQEDPCLQGGDPSYYGSFKEDDGYGENDDYSKIKDSTGNIAIIDSTKSYFSSNGGSCGFDDSYTRCNGSSLNFYADSSGYVGADDDSIGCGVHTDGSAYCY